MPKERPSHSSTAGFALGPLHLPPSKVTRVAPETQELTNEEKKEIINELNKKIRIESERSEGYVANMEMNKRREQALQGLELSTEELKAPGEPQIEKLKQLKKRVQNAKTRSQLYEIEGLKEHVDIEQALQNVSHPKESKAEPDVLFYQILYVKNALALYQQKSPPAILLVAIDRFENKLSGITSQEKLNEELLDLKNIINETKLKNKPNIDEIIRDIRPIDEQKLNQERKIEISKAIKAERDEISNRPKNVKEISNARLSERKQDKINHVKILGDLKSLANDCAPKGKAQKLLQKAIRKQRTHIETLDWRDKLIVKVFGKKY